MMTVQVLLATMHQEDHSILEKLRLDSDAVVINQCGRVDRKEFSWNGYRVLWIDTTERGLSRSRNRAVEAAWGDICLIADDDEELCAGYAQKIAQAYEKKPGADIIRFQIRGIERPFKTYQKHGMRFGYLLSMKISSVEITFRRRSVVAKGLRFDPRFGAGTQCPMGEESLFLFRCLDEGLQIRYEPMLIADLHVGISTWFTGYHEDYFIGKGCVFTAMSKKWSRLLIWQAAIRKRHLYRKEMTVLSAVRLMMQGRRIYLQSV